MKNFAKFNVVWNTWGREGHAPARACGEAKLAHVELMVKVIVGAAYE